MPATAHLHTPPATERLPAGARIGFLLNHAAPHQVFHAAPIAFELSRQYPELSATLICSSPRVEAAARRIGSLYTDHRVRFQRARVPRGFRLMQPLLEPVRLVEKDAVRGFNRELFREFDALVVPEANSLKLKGRADLSHLRMIYTHHGAGDRSIGYHERHRAFDLILCPGDKVRSRMSGELGIPDSRLAVTGYPKFEVVDQLDPPEPLFANDKPVVLYNPHFSNREASWRSHGLQVLEFFKNQRDYNLIFAPHVLLYKRALRHGGRPLRRFRGLPNIHIDTGSEASVDMTYTALADIYLGDISSQVYEFIRNPRPCLFIDTGEVRNPADRLCQRMGDVLQDTSELPVALASAFERHERYYKDIQQELFRSAFDTSDRDRSPATRAAMAIRDFLEAG